MPGSHHDKLHYYVEGHSYLLYYHLWLTAAPNLLHVAASTLPANVMNESNNTSTTTTLFSDVEIIGKKDIPAIKGLIISAIASVF